MGIRVREARKAAGLTQEMLAEKADLATRTVQKVESGQITILVTTLKRLRNAIGCNYDSLLGQ